MLEKFYKGDKYWNDFVSVFPNHEKLQEDKRYMRLYEELNMNKDLSVVIYELIGIENSIDWINSNNPALDGLKPLECLEGCLLNRLRTMLMRF